MIQRRFLGVLLFATLPIWAQPCHADGVLKMERIGFGTGEDGWVDEMIGAMEKARPK